MAHFKNFTPKMREDKKKSNRGKRSWEAAKQGKSKVIHFHIKNKIYFYYNKKVGFKKSLGGGSNPRGCKRGGRGGKQGKGKKCPLCHPPYGKKRIKNIKQEEVFAV